MDSARYVAQLLANDNKVMYLMRTASGDSNGDRIDVDRPLWDQRSYFGRWRHYAFITDCRTILASREELEKARDLCEEYKAGREPSDCTREDIIYAKKLRDSAFHPDNGELMHVLGRMSFQLPSSLALTATMLTFYKSAIQVAACQLLNQALNAFVNYTNRNAMDEDAEGQDNVKQAFACATAASCAAAVGFRKLLSRKGPVYARWVPFCAVVAGNMVNLPIMRQQEIKRGIPIMTEDSEQPIMKSRVAAVKGISECVISRIVMAAPGMLMIPLITQRIKPYCFYQYRPWIAVPIELGLCVMTLLVMIPTALAIFPQCNSMRPRLMKLYANEYCDFRERVGKDSMPDKVYYNKGL